MNAGSCLLVVGFKELTGSASWSSLAALAAVIGSTLCAESGAC